MSGSKLGGILQPAWARTAAALVETTAVWDKLQPALRATSLVSYEAANLIAAFLSPAALIAFVFGLWRLCADLGWAGEFAISKGVFSHWQVWFLTAFVLKSTGSLINRGGRDKERE